MKTVFINCSPKKKFSDGVTAFFIFFKCENKN